MSAAAAKHTTRELLDAMQRASYLLDAVHSFIKHNPIADYTLLYDEAICDGACLAEDCKIAADELRLQIQKAGAQ